MVKSASETKVEDILSSVRRLVSEELPRNERPAVPQGPGALVLTDSQRIESNAAIRIAGRSLEERIAELEAAVGETANDDEFEPDGSEDQAIHRPDRIVYTRPPDQAESAAMRRNTLRLSQIALIDTGDDSDTRSDDESDENTEVPLQFRRESRSVAARDATDPPEAPMALDVKETLTAAEVHIFSSPDDEIERITARLNGEPMPDPVPVNAEKTVDADETEDVPVFNPPADEADLDPTAPEPTRERASKIDLINKVVGAMKGEPTEHGEKRQGEASDVLVLSTETADAAFEADLEDAVAASITVDDKDDHVAPAEEIATPEQESPAKLVAVEEAEAAEITPAEAPDTKTQVVETAIVEEAIEDTVVDILDEEEVRPLVARLIREELQGELGEQITRNVRKLVRREILRALAARDAE